MKSHAKIFAIVFGIVLLGILTACYVSMCGFYRTHCLPNSYIGDTNVSGWSASDIESYYSSVSNHRSLLLVGKEDASVSVDLSDVDFVISLQDDFENVISEQSYQLWFLSYFKKQQYDQVLLSSYDSDKLERKIKALNIISGEDVVAPQDAYLDVGEDGYEIFPEVEGNTIDFDLLWNTLESTLSDSDALLSSKEIVVDISEDYLLPSVYEDDEGLQTTLASINELIDKTVVIDLVDATERPDRAQMSSFVVINEDGSVSFDSDKVSDYVTMLAKQYTTLHSTRDFVTSAGDTIQLQSDDDSYGFIFDKSGTTDAIMAALESEDSEVTVDAVWWEGYGLPKQRNSKQGDIGNTYIEVSIDEQHMWYYKDGELMIDTDVVTGLDTDSRRTPTGVYFIWNKESPSRLTGSYGSSYVNYWMAFSWDGCGIHDSTWRSNYGGNIYLTNGSHGCVNTPYDIVSQLYSMVEYDTPVVVYRR